MVCALVAGRCLAVASATRPLTLLAFPVHYQRSTTTRSLTSSATGSGSTPTTENKTPAQDPDEAHQEKKSAEMERRMQALKRFGLPKTMDEGILPQGKPVEGGEKKKNDGKEGEEQDWNAIYGDYIWYRDNQTTKGWKS
jgi:hypothetical protein